MHWFTKTNSQYWPVLLPDTHIISIKLLISFKLVVNYIRNFLVRRHSMRKRKKNRIDWNFEVMIWTISFQYKRLQFAISMVWTPPPPSPTIFLLKKKKRKKEKKDSTAIVSLLVKHPNLSPPSIFIKQEQHQQQPR